MIVFKPFFISTVFFTLMIISIYIVATKGGPDISDKTNAGYDAAAAKQAFLEALKAGGNGGGDLGGFSWVTGFLNK